MKKLHILAILLLTFLSVAMIKAQNTEIELETFTSEGYGIQGLAPAAWENVAPGVYGRGASETDFTLLAIQSAPISMDDLLSALTPQLGIEAFPEPESQLETDFATWSIYLVEVTTPITVNVSVAAAELDGAAYVVVLQSAPEEHEDLREAVFMPVVESVAAYEAEEAEEVPYIVQEVSIPNGDINLAGTLTIPEGEGEFPAVVFVTGSGAQDRDESLTGVTELKPFRELADYLTRHGIAVLRYDDRGFGESEGDYTAATFTEFVSDVNAAVAFLVEQDMFTHIGVVGHSEGGTYAPEVGVSNDNVDFVVALAGVTVPVIDVIQEQSQLIMAAEGASEEDLAALDTAITDLRQAYESGDDDALRLAVIDYLVVQTGTEPADELIDATFEQFTSPIFGSYFEYDPAEYWLVIEKPMLAIFGSLDLQVSAAQSIPIIEGKNDNITIVTIDNMNHLFQEAETGSPSEYGSLAPQIMPELLETVTEWILEVTAD